MPAAWLSGFTKRFQVTLPADKVSANISDFQVHITISADAGLNAADLTQMFRDLNKVSAGIDEGEYKIAVTLADGTTEVAVEIARWDWANERAHLWIGPVDLDATAGLTLYLYWNPEHLSNPDSVGDQWNGDPSGPWNDGNHVLVQHMTRAPKVIEIEDEIDTDEVPDHGFWQGVATEDEHWFALTSEPIGANVNGIRKYLIEDKSLVASDLAAYSGGRANFAFSTGAIIDDKLMIVIRDEGGADDAHVVEYDLDTLAEGVDYDIAFDTYEYPEGVAKHSIDGETTYYWVMFGGNGNVVIGTYPNGRKCAVIRYDYPTFANPVAYDLYDLDVGNWFGGQDIKFISATDFLTVPHGTSGGSAAEHPRGFLERWHWNGTTFEFVTKFETPADGGGGNKLGQGFDRLSGFPDNWYFAARDQAGAGVNSKLIKCTFERYSDPLVYPDFSTNANEPDGATPDPTTAPAQEDDGETGYRQQFGGDGGDEDHIRFGQGANLELSTGTIEATFLADDFIEAANERNTIFFLKGGIYLQVRGAGSGQEGHVAVYFRTVGGGGAHDNVYVFSAVALNPGQRYHLMVTFDPTTDTAVLYINGQEDTEWADVQGALSYIGTAVNSAGAEVSDPGGGVINHRFLEGRIMELRVTDDVKSAAWAEASYHNGIDQLLTFGALESNILATTTTFALTVPQPTVEVEVVADEDVPVHISDAAHLFLTGENLGIGFLTTGVSENNAFAARFRGVQIPQGARIRSAHIRFEAADSLAEVNVNGRIDGLAVDNSSTPTHAEFDGGSVGAASHGRATANRTSAQVLWSLIAAITAGQSYNTPDIKAIIQEITSRSGWAEGNALTLFVGDEDHESTQNDGRFRAFTRNAVPVLVVTYTEAPAEYTILLRDSDTLNLLSELPTYRAATWRRHATESGDFSIQTHLAFIENVDHIRGKRVVEIRRDGAFEFAGKIEVVEFDEITKLVTIAGPDLLGYWLSLRDIDPGGSEFDTQVGVVGETALKHYVEDHLTAPSVAARNVNLELDGIDFTVEGDGVRGSDVDYNARWVNLLAALIDLARAADVLHDVVLKDAYTGYEYRVSSPIDATEDTGLVPVIFSADWENVGQLVYREDFSRVINAITMLGTGSGAARNTEEVTDPVSIAADYRREGHKDERQADNAAKLVQQGAVAIAQSLFDAVTADTEPLIVGPTLYKEQWDVGYDVTLSLVSFGVKVDRRIVEVKVSLDEQNMETIEISLGASQVGFVRAVVEALRKTNPAQVV